MHPELLSYLAAEHRRDLHAAMSARRAAADRARPRAPRVSLPRFRVSWTRRRGRQSPRQLPRHRHLRDPNRPAGRLRPGFAGPGSLIRTL
jgi:hypothetical protein